MAEPRLRPAFFYALRNTVVAPTMDRAAEIAYARDSAFRKVVTLKVRAKAAPAKHVFERGRPELVILTVCRLHVAIGQAGPG